MDLIIVPGNDDGGRPRRPSRGTLMMRQRSNILLIGPLLLPAADVAQRPVDQDAKRAFEIADYFATALVGAPRMTADGSRVVLPVTRQQLD